MTAGRDPRTAEIERELLLEAIRRKFHYDFREYAPASLARRLELAMQRFECRTLSELQVRVLHEPDVFPALLDFLTVQVGDLFRDPAYFRAVRDSVIPVLRTYPSIKVWVAGCGTGEEAYSFAILLQEEGLLDRSLIYATDINPGALQRAADGVYDAGRAARFTANHRASGGRGSLSAHYTAAYGGILIGRDLRSRIVFADHSLATDSVFAEVQMVSCRNVLIYFEPSLQERAIGLFREALCRLGFLGLGLKETLTFSAHVSAFAEVDLACRLYRKMDDVRGRLGA